METEERVQMEINKTRLLCMKCKQGITPINGEDQLIRNLTQLIDSECKKAVEVYNKSYDKKTNKT